MSQDYGVVSFSVINEEGSLAEALQAFVDYVG